MLLEISHQETSQKNLTGVIYINFEFLILNFESILNDLILNV